jgi:hypothetical protein
MLTVFMEYNLCDGYTPYHTLYHSQTQKYAPETGKIKGSEMISKLLCTILHRVESLSIQFTYQLLNEIKLTLPEEKSGSCCCDELLFLNSMLFFQTSKMIKNTRVFTYLLILQWACMDWIDVAQDRDQWKALVNMVMNLVGSINAGNFLSSCTTGGFLRRAQLREVSYLLIPLYIPHTIRFSEKYGFCHTRSTF